MADEFSGRAVTRVACKAVCDMCSCTVAFPRYHEHVRDAHAVAVSRVYLTVSLSVRKMRLLFFCLRGKKWGFLLYSAKHSVKSGKPILGLAMPR